MAPTLQRGGDSISLNSVPSVLYRQSNFGLIIDDEVTSPMLARNHKGGPQDLVASYNHRDEVRGRLVVRRLTPLECLRLQGFPYDWVGGVTYRGKPLTDSQLYKLCGNSWAVPVAGWVIGRVVQLGFGAVGEKADHPVGRSPQWLNLRTSETICHGRNRGSSQAALWSCPQ